MKINREPVHELSDEMVRKDHEFWRRYSSRLIGDWITYDTPVREICEFAERLYLRRDYREFDGDRKFIRDDNAQKAFSKLRSSIGGIYSWRLGYMGVDCPPRFRANKNSDELHRVTREAEFAFKQAFAFCPYSPEAVSRFAQFLVNQQRIEDAILLAATCLKFDPGNSHISGLLQQLESIRLNQAQPRADRSADMKKAFAQITAMIQQGQGTQVVPLLDQMVASPAADVEVVLFAVGVLVQIRDFPRLERALDRMTQLLPQNPEAWYDLAGIQMTLGKRAEAVVSLQRAFHLSDERIENEPQARNLRREAAKDPRFSGEFHPQPE